MRLTKFDKLPNIFFMYIKNHRTTSVARKLCFVCLCFYAQRKNSFIHWLNLIHLFCLTDIYQSNIHCNTCCTNINKEEITEANVTNVKDKMHSFSRWPRCNAMMLPDVNNCQARKGYLCLLMFAFCLIVLAIFPNYFVSL